MVLLNLLLDLKKEKRLRFAVAHVDHGWRSESVAEASFLQEYCRNLNLPFYLKTLNPENMQGNLEAACREARLQFFHEICCANQFKAVMLAHHADDHAETIFKRILEGTTLPHLHGLKEQTHVNGLLLWRPLLHVNKADIESYVIKLELRPFVDSTNCNPKYLRARLRKLLPEISKHFGKEIRSTLTRLGEESAELHDYLMDKLKPIAIHSGPLGSYVDIATHQLHPFEARFLLRKLCERENVFFSHDLIGRACQHLLSGRADCWVMMGNKKMCLDRGRAFVLREVQIPTRQPLDHVFGPWRIKFDAGRQSKGWESVWKGEIIVDLPPGEYEIGLPDATINKKWSNAKIPAFLKHLIPVIWKNNKMWIEKSPVF